MTGPARPHDRRWRERSVIAAMVIVGFAIGSLGLTIAAELLGEDPLLTDEFNAPIADDDADAVVAVAVTTTTTSPPPTTIAPSVAAGDRSEEDRSRADDNERERSGRGDRSDRSDREVDREQRQRA